MLHTIGCEKGRFTVSPNQIPLVANPPNHLTFDDGYEAIYHFLLIMPEDFCRRVTIFLVTEKIGGANDWDKCGELSGLPLLDWDQLEKLKKLNVKFGSHSATHPDLRNLSGNELDREIKESKQMLESRLGIAVEAFCYPYGLFNDKTVCKVKEAGYKWACTTSDSIWEGRCNPYRKRRIEIKGTDSKWLVRLKLSPLYHAKALWELPVLLLEKYCGMKRQ